MAPQNPEVVVSYRLVTSNPPARHERQMPKVLPLPMMFVQRLVMLANS